MAMLMSFCVAGNLTKDIEVSKTGKGIEHYLMTLYLSKHSRDKRHEETRVKIKARSSIENTWLKNAKKGDPVTITFDRGTQFWSGDNVVVISGWTNQIRLHEARKYDADGNYIPRDGETVQPKAEMMPKAEEDDINDEFNFV